MIEPRGDRPRPITLGADKAYDAEDFVNELRSMNATPHVAQNANGRSSAIDGRTTRRMGFHLRSRHDTRAMPRANASANGSRKPSAGSRRSAGRGRPSSAVARDRGGVERAWPGRCRPRERARALPPLPGYPPSSPPAGASTEGFLRSRWGRTRRPAGSR